MSSFLKKEIRENCNKCNGSGYVDLDMCSCFIKYRAFHRLLSGGFSKKLLEIVSKDDYTFPVIENEEEFSMLEKYVDNPGLILKRGLSLYIYSQEYGRGKTTLAHFIAFGFASYFMETWNYQDITAKSNKRKDLFIFRNAQEVLEDPAVCFSSPFLVLDDMGNENKSAKWKRENTIATFQRLFHEREDKALVTIITSNYSPFDLNGLYGRDLESLLEITPESRIHGSKFRQIEVGGGEDLRFVHNDKNWDL